MKMKEFFSYTIISCLLPLVLSIPLFELLPWAARKNTYLDDFEVSIPFDVSVIHDLSLQFIENVYLIFTPQYQN